jgi:hypothetical protein
MLVHACDPSYTEAGVIQIRGLLFEVRQGKKLARPPSQRTSWAWWHESVVPAIQKVEIGRSWSVVCPEQKCKTVSKNK